MGVGVTAQKPKISAASGIRPKCEPAKSERFTSQERGWWIARTPSGSLLARLVNPLLRLFMASRLGLLLACAAAFAWAPPSSLGEPATSAPANQTTDFTADSIATEFDSGDYIGTGNARLRDGPVLVTADQIRYNPKTQVARAAGHVTLTYRSERLLADQLTYERGNGNFTTGPLRIGTYPYYIEGESAEGSPRTEMIIHEATITFREPGAWQPTIHAKSVIYSPGHFLRIGTARAGLGNTRPLPVIRFHQDLSKPSEVSFLAVEAGERGQLGPFIDVGVNLPIADGVSAGPDVGLYTRRGLMIGPIANYDLVTADDKIDGFLKSGYIKDYGTRGIDEENVPVPTNRAWTEWENHAKFGDSLTIDGDVNWWSDSEVYRDFHTRQFLQIQEPDNFLESNYTGSNFFFSAFTRFQPNPFDLVQQRLPEIRFDLLPSTLPGGLGVVQRFDASVAYLKELPPVAGTDLAADRFDAFYGLSRRFSYRDWFDVTPVAGARFTDYWDTEGAEEAGGTHRLLGELGFDADLKASASWDYQNALWHIDGLRHLIDPILSYRYIPNGDKGSQFIPPIDRSTFSTDLPILELGDMRAVDQMQAVNVLRVGLNNTLQTRDPEYGSRDLATLNVADDLRFQRAPGEQSTSNIHADLGIMPAKWLEFRVSDAVATGTLAQKEWNSNLTLRDSDVWSIGIGVGYLTDNYGYYSIPGVGTYPVTGLDGYHFEATVRINEEYTAFTRIDYDDRAHLFADQYYGIRQKLANTWQVQYALSIFGGPSREHGVGFTVSVEILRY